MFDQNLGTDVADFTEAVVEQETTFDEAITIKRFSSQPSTPGAFGTPQKIQYTTFAATAVVVEENVAASMFAAGVLQAGDLVLQMRERLTESNENIGGSTPGDHVLWRGSEYRQVQRPHAVTIGGDSFYIAHLRRANLASDVTGQ